MFVLRCETSASRFVWVLTGAAAWWCVTVCSYELHRVETVQKDERLGVTCIKSYEYALFTYSRTDYGGGDSDSESSGVGWSLRTAGTDLPSLAVDSHLTASQFGGMTKPPTAHCFAHRPHSFISMCVGVALQTLPVSNADRFTFSARSNRTTPVPVRYSLRIRARVHHRTNTIQSCPMYIRFLPSSKAVVAARSGQPERHLYRPSFRLLRLLVVVCGAPNHRSLRSPPLPHGTVRVHVTSDGRPHRLAGSYRARDFCSLNSHHITKPRSRDILQRMGFFRSVPSCTH